MTIMVRVEIVPATDIKDASTDMIALARRMDAAVVANFNGCQLTANEYTSHASLMTTYQHYCDRQRHK